MSKNHSFLAFVLVSVFILLSQSTFVLQEGEQALVLQFGETKGSYTEPGLKFKTPFIQQVKLFEKRVLDVDPPPEEIILADQKRMVVDTFARYRITDMLEFYKSLATEAQAMSRLNNIINSTTRSVLGKASMTDILSEKRSPLMNAVRQQANAAVKYMGIEIVDVRIGRADLPEQTSQSIFARMKTEREREAAEFRAQGQEAAQEIRSKAEKERTVILADASKQAEIAKGQGDQQAIRIYADAFRRDP